MKNQLICCNKSQNGTLNISYCSAQDLLLNYLNQRSINYYCSSNGNIEMYFRLRSTGIRIKQSIDFSFQGYRCITKIIEKPRGYTTKNALLLAQISSINKELTQGKFVYNFETKQLSFIDSFSTVKKGVLNTQNAFERFERLVFLPHHLLDIAYPLLALKLFDINTEGE